MSKTVSIQASSKISVKIRDNFYTTEYAECRSLEDGDDLVNERIQLWNDVNNEVDNQVAAIFDYYGPQQQ